MGQKAQTIPWLEIEHRYATLFINRKGNVAKPLRLALDACIIQSEYGYSDEEAALQIQENPYLQYPRMFPCSTKPGRTRKSSWTFFMILPMVRSPAPTASATGKII